MRKILTDIFHISVQMWLFLRNVLHLQGKEGQVIDLVSRPAITFKKLHKAMIVAQISMNSYKYSHFEIYVYIVIQKSAKK